MSHVMSQAAVEGARTWLFGAWVGMVIGGVGAYYGGGSQVMGSALQGLIMA